MKFVDGFMIHSGYPVREYIDSAVTHVHLRQGMNVCAIMHPLLSIIALFVKVCWVSR
jgi:ribosomal protein S3